MSSLAALKIVPVRHHSPAAALAVERAILEARPRLVLIEGPCDASELIPLLLQPDTRPPVAILAYRPAAEGEEPRVMVDPFCDYSPELVAMRVAAGIGAAVRFCDAPAGAWLDRETGVPGEEPPSGDALRGEILPDFAPSELFRSLAERFGCSTHEEFWDSRFEMTGAQGWQELMASYGDMVRSWFVERGRDRELDLSREAWMLHEVARAGEEGYPPEEILLVCGAAHLAGLRQGITDLERVERLRATPPVRFALIPYSFPRLSEQSGYGAGNRAPAYYQAVWARRGDWNAASLDYLLRLMNALRARGYALSLADVIEAQRLAANLAGLRDKPAAGLEEVADAAVACYGRDGYDPRPYLLQLLVGEEIGSLPSLAAKTALQQEFHDQVKRRGIPFSDSPRELRLNLTDPSQRASSVFLHRLVVAGIPFATLGRIGSLASGASSARAVREQDPLERLLALREKWEVRWTPGTDLRLIELAPFGNTQAEVCERLLRRRMEAARSLAEIATVLLEVVVGRLDALYQETLAACERASSEDDDFVSLSRAAHLLDGLVSYGDTPGQVELLARLSDRVFARASLLLPGAAGVAEEEAGRLCEGMKLLHQVASRRRLRGEGEDLLLERLLRTAQGEGEAHPRAAGLACALLFLDGRLSEEDLAAALGLRLSRGEEPLRGARFLEGLFSLNRSVLVRNRALVERLTEFLAGLEWEPFLAVLPVLRRSLADITPGERGYLEETIVEVLRIGRGQQEAEVPAEPAEAPDLSALDQEMGDLFS